MVLSHCELCGSDSQDPEHARARVPGTSPPPLQAQGCRPSQPSQPTLVRPLTRMPSALVHPEQGNPAFFLGGRRNGVSRRWD